MTSIVAEDEQRTKRKSGNEKMSIVPNGRANSRDETRSFIHFSRENLSICHSELEQGFDKPARCLRMSRHTLLSVIAILVALVCAAIEISMFHRVIINAREIEILKRDVESLRHRMFGKDFMDELKAFEEQLYADGTEEEDEDSDIEAADYDNNYYEDYGPCWNEAMEDSRGPTASTTGASTTAQSRNPLVKGDDDSKSALSASPRGEDRKRKIEASHKNIAREGLLDGTPRRTEFKHHPKQRRAVTDMFDLTSDSRNRTSRRQIIDHSDNPIAEATPRNHRRHPPKKYFGPTRSENSHGLAASRQDSSERRIMSLEQRRNSRKSEEVSKVPPSKSVQPRGITRRHVRAPRQVFAAHYGADSSLFGMDDEHTGNGRAKHNEGVFKAWRPSDWLADLGMTRHFSLSRDGRLTVHEPGLYLLYAQIHYLDEHDENGFHILVNNHPILQCMLYSPGMGHKSRSCFSAQITLFQSGDRLVLKDVGPARYTLFQHDKSFFGLVKLGDSRQQQRQHSTPPPAEAL